MRNERKRILSLILCAVILVGLLPTNIWAAMGSVANTAEQDEKSVEISTTTTSTTTKTVYVLTTNISSGNSYLIANKNASGSAELLKNNNGSVSSTTVTVQYGNVDDDNDNETYIELDDAANELWTASGNSSTTLKNGNYYLRYNNRSLSLSTSNSTTWTWSSNNNQLSYAVTGNSGGNNGGDNNRPGSSSTTTYYLRYNNGWGVSTSTNSVYFYVPQEIEITTEETTTVKYSVSASDITYVFPESAEEGSTHSQTISASVLADGTATDTLGETYSYAIVSDENGIIDASDSGDGILVFTGKEGTAKVRVYYEFTENGEQYTIWDTISVTATLPFYTVDITKTATDTDGNRTAGEPIKNTVVVKNVTSESTYDLWAAVYQNGTEYIKLDANDLTWSSSNTAVATVDNDGIVHFTGTDGTTIITVYYEYTSDGQTVYATDRVTISATTGNYVIPEDGTNDFPNYPNEGAIRFDKTAAAVGNFSETGIVQVELSMTGVPYTTGNAIDVLLMLDMSTSMDTEVADGVDRVDVTIAAAKAFAETIVKNEDGTYNSNKIAIKYFNGSTVYTTTDYITVSSDAELSALNTLIEELYTPTSSGTYYSVAMENAYNTIIAQDAVSDNTQTLVFMSDGGPTYYTYLNDSGTGTTVSSTNASTFVGWFDVDNNDTDDEYDDTATPNSNFKTEYYSYLLKNAGYPVYTVGLGLSTNDSGPNGYTALTSSAHEAITSYILSQMASAGRFYNIADSDAVSNMSNIFSGIAQSILEAAKDVAVQDKISDDYTMVFEVPSESITVGDGQEFYIEVKEYTLKAVTNTNGQITDYTRDTYTSLIKLYLGKTTTNGVTSYYAASDSSGTAFAKPAFSKTALGPSGSKFYWSLNENDSGISVSGSYTETTTDDSGNTTTETKTGTFYFVADGSGDFNMTSGAYAHGTLSADTVINPDTEEVKTDTNTQTSQDLIIATPYFVYYAETRMLVWTAEKLSSTELALSYFLYLNGSAGGNIEPDTYETNDYAHLTYDNFQENECLQELPVPQITWNGAQVSYVFYLVNENGQPVNKAGQVVPFSEAVYVTDVHTQSVVWSDDEEVDSLDASLLAEKLVPSVYELYDSGASYTIHVYKDEDELKLNNHFLIDSGFASSAQDNEAVNYETTYVFNTKADATKYRTPGIYAAETEEGKILCKDYDVKKVNDDYKYDGEYEQYLDNGTDAVYGEEIQNDGTVKYYTIVKKAYDKKVDDGFDFYNTTVAFAVVWKPTLVEDTVVIDYGMDVLVDVVENDLMASGSVVGVSATVPASSGVDMNTGRFDQLGSGVGSSAVLSINSGNTAVTIGQVEVESDGKSVYFAIDPSAGMLLNEPIFFYYVFEINYYKDTELKTEYMYSRVTIIPATTMYYEEDFVTFDAGGTVREIDITEEVENDDGTVTTVTNTQSYKSVPWTPVNDSKSYTKIQDTDRPGPNQGSSAFDADNLYGYDSAYLNCTTYSLGSARSVTVNAGSYATASFTFWGTGFDLISLTSKTSGTIIAEIVNQNGTTIGDTINPIFVDTYYGYTYTDADGQWTVDTESKDTIWQVPVITKRDLPYGKYTVTITVSYSVDDGEEGNYQFDHNQDKESIFCLDAVRIYDPTGVVSGAVTNNVVTDAYIADGEWGADYEELRNELLTEYGTYNMTDDFTVFEFEDEIDASDEFDEPVFIDGLEANTSVEFFKLYGPNNEVYLDAGQAIAILVDSSYLTNVKDKLAGVTDVSDIQMGFKIATGSDVSVSFANYLVTKQSDGTLTCALDANSKETLTLSTATDMYYSILDHYYGILVIENTGTGVLSLTNIKVTFVPEATATTSDEVESDGNDETPSTESGEETSGTEENGNGNKVVANFFTESFHAVVTAVANVVGAIERWLNNLSAAIFGTD